MDFYATVKTRNSDPLLIAHCKKRPPPKGENGGGEKGILSRRFNM
jgi:hypothetical protein